MQRKEMEIKYAPITDSINKLVGKKSQTQTQSKNPFLNENYYKNYDEKYMEVDEDLISFEESRKNKNTNPFTSNGHSNMKTENMRIDESGDRQSQGTNQYDVVRIYANDDSKNPFRKSVRIPKSSPENLLSSARNSLSINRKNQRVTEHNENRQNIEQHVSSDRKRRQIDSENHDFERYFLEPKTKRCRMTLNKTCRRKHTPTSKLASDFGPEFALENNERLTIQSKRALNKNPSTN